MFKYSNNNCFVLKEIAFFDDAKNSTGALTTRLATDASAVQGVSYSTSNIKYTNIILQKWFLNSRGRIC